MALDRLCSFVLLRWFSMIHLDIVLRKESTEHVSVPDPMVMVCAGRISLLLLQGCHLQNI